MVYIYTISDKALTGKQINILPAYLSECFFKNNLKIEKQCILPSDTNFNQDLNITLNNSNIYIFLVDKANLSLNGYLSQLCNCQMIENPYIKQALQEYYKKHNQVPTKDEENGWKIPSLAHAVINPNGMVQGYLLSFKNNIFCVLPNNYQEAREMFDDVVLNFLLDNQKKKYKSYTFKTFGLSENGITQVLYNELKNKDKVTINFFSKPFEVDIVIKALADNQHLENIAKSILLKLDKFIYAVEDVPIESVLYELLRLNDITVGFVEDITCGELMSRLNKQAPDAKKYIAPSFVLTKIEDKITKFSIDKNLFDESGDINANVAYTLAVEYLKNNKADLVIATVGTTTSKENIKAGLSFIAIGDRNEVHVYKNIFKGSHEQIVDSICSASYFYLIKKLKKNDFHFEQITV